MQRPPVGQRFLTVEASRSYPGTPHSVGVYWTSDQPHAHLSLPVTTDLHAPGGIETRDPSKRTAADSRLRPRGHRDRPKFISTHVEIYCSAKVSYVLFVTLHCRFLPLCCSVIVLFLPHCSVLH
jgi:hypothetical protein